VRPRLGHLSQHDIAGRCACADEVEQLTRRQAEVFRHVRWYECSGAGSGDDRPARRIASGVASRRANNQRFLGFLAFATLRLRGTTL
jgi:hypothetical protein